MPLPSLPADPEPSAEQLAAHFSGKWGNEYDFIARGMARIAWRVQLQKQDPDAFHIYFASDIRDENYSAYLYSSEWRRIKRRVLKVANKKCRCCGGVATTVHHRDYRPRVLRGEDLLPLVAICEPCHKRVHETSDGKRRNTWNESEEELAAMVAENEARSL